MLKVVALAQLKETLVHGLTKLEDNDEKNRMIEYGFAKTIHRLTFLSVSRLAFYGARFASECTHTALVQMSPFESESVLSA